MAAKGEVVFAPCAHAAQASKTNNESRSTRIESASPSILSVGQVSDLPRASWQVGDLPHRYAPPQPSKYFGQPIRISY